MITYKPGGDESGENTLSYETKRNRKKKTYQNKIIMLAVVWSGVREGRCADKV